MIVLKDKFGEVLRRADFEGARNGKVERENVWRFHKDKKGRNCLICEGSWYEIDLDDLINAEAVLVCLTQLLSPNERGWFKGKAVSDLIESLDVYLPLVDLGCDDEVDITEYLWGLRQELRDG